MCVVPICLILQKWTFEFKIPILANHQQLGIEKLISSLKIRAREARSEYSTALQLVDQPVEESLMWLTSTRVYKQWLSNWNESGPFSSVAPKTVCLAYSPSPPECRPEVAVQVCSMLDSVLGDRSHEILYFRCPAENENHSRQVMANPKDVLRSWISQFLVPVASEVDYTGSLRTLLASDEKQMLKKLFASDDNDSKNKESIPIELVDCLSMVLEFFPLSKVLLGVENVQLVATAGPFFNRIIAAIQPSGIEGVATASSFEARIFLTDTSKEPGNQGIFSKCYVVDGETEYNGQYFIV